MTTHSRSLLIALGMLLPSLAQAMECRELTGWSGGGNYPFAVTVPVDCELEDPAFAWTEIRLSYGTPLPQPLHLRIPRSDPHVRGPYTFHPLIVYAGHSGGAPQLRQDLILDGGPNEMPLTADAPLCGADASWYDGDAIDPGYDGANCSVAPWPTDAEGFVHDGDYYVEPERVCDVGTLDPLNCHIAPVPAGTTPLISGDSLYLLAPAYTLCPLGSFSHYMFPYTVCHVATALPGTRPFIYDKRLYTTPRRQCPAGWGELDSVGCYMGSAPDGKHPFAFPPLRGFFYVP